MRYWLVRVLLNLGVLAGAAAIGFAGLMTTGSPIGFGFSVLIYFFVAWGLANHVTRGRAQVGLGAYVGPLFLTYIPLCLAGMFYLTAMEFASEVDPDAPTFTMGLPLLLEEGPWLQIIGGGIGLAVVLIIPPLVAIVDRPPPGHTVETTATGDLPMIGNMAQPAIAAPGAVEQVRQVPPPQPQADLPTDVDREETLEELLGLEPTRHG